MFLLTGYSIFHYLVNHPDKSINIGFDSIKNNLLEIKEYFKSTRNNVFKITIENKNLIIKQPHNNAKNFVTSIKNEANFYTFLKHTGLRLSIIGDFISYDSENYILSFSTDRDFHSIDRDIFIDRTELRRFIKGFTKILVEVHHSLKDVTRQASYYFYPFTPILLDNDRRKILMRDMRNAESRALRIMADEIEKIEKSINALARQWNANETIIHGDVRYQNFIFNTKNLSYKLIDWEMATLGDSCWDLVSFCAIILKDLRTPGNFSLHPNLNPEDCYLMISDTINQYYINQFEGETEASPEFVKKILQLSVLNVAQNYIIGALNTGNDENHEVVFYFFELLYDNTPDFYSNYLANKINGNL